VLQAIDLDWPKTVEPHVPMETEASDNATDCQVPTASGDGSLPEKQADV